MGRFATKRLVVLAILPAVVIPGEAIRPRAVPTLAELAEQFYRRHLPMRDPNVLGRPLAYWRAAAKCGGIHFGGWAGHAEFWDGPESAVVMIHDPGSDQVSQRMLALADDPDPGVRLVAARGL